MPKSKRHHPRLKRKTHRKYRGGGYHGGATPVVAEKMTSPRKCASSGFFGFGSPAPYGCSSAEAVVKSLTAFYNEGLTKKEDKTNEYNESKTWLTTQLKNYLNGQGVFGGNGPQMTRAPAPPLFSDQSYSGAPYSGQSYSGAPTSFSGYSDQSSTSYNPYGSSLTGQQRDVPGGFGYAQGAYGSGAY